MMKNDYKEYKNARMYPPIRSSEVNSDEVVFGYGGILDEFDDFIEDSSFIRNGRKFFLKPIKKINIKNKLFGKYIYGGMILVHYGHFIIESLTRIWFYEKEKIPILFFLASKGFAKPKHFEKSFVKEIFEIIGIKNYKFITENTLVENLIVPMPKCRHGTWKSEDFLLSDNFIPENKKAFMEQDYINSISKITCKEEDLQYKVWISRSDLIDSPIKDNDKNRPKFDWVLSLEEELKNLGWIIFHPQHFSVKNQIKIISKAKVLAGFDGSAFFSLLFLKNYKGQIKIFNRGKKRICDMYYLIRDKITNLNIEFIREKPDKNLILEKLKYL